MKTHVTLSYEYEAGDIYNMPVEQQKQVIMQVCSEADWRRAQQDLFPAATILALADRRTLQKKDPFEL